MKRRWFVYEYVLALRRNTNRIVDDNDNDNERRKTQKNRNGVKFSRTTIINTRFVLIKYQLIISVHIDYRFKWFNLINLNFFFVSVSIRSGRIGRMLKFISGRKVYLFSLTVTK